MYNSAAPQISKDWKNTEAKIPMIGSFRTAFISQSPRGRFSIRRFRAPSFRAARANFTRIIGRPFFMQEADVAMRVLQFRILSCLRTGAEVRVLPKMER
jgi:hypothetical protein